MAIDYGHTLKVTAKPYVIEYIYEAINDAKKDTNNAEGVYLSNIFFKDNNNRGRIEKYSREGDTLTIDIGNRRYSNFNEILRFSFMYDLKIDFTTWTDAQPYTFTEYKAESGKVYEQITTEHGGEAPLYNFEEIGLFEEKAEAVEQREQISLPF